MHFSSLAQICFETQLGGSNFLGLTFNTRFEFPLDADKNHRIIPQLGVGFLAPYREHPEAFTMPLIVQGALTYQYKRWGIGCETSGFTRNPFFGNGTGYGPTGWIDLLVYPNLNYTFGKGTKTVHIHGIHCFVRISLNKLIFLFRCHAAFLNSNV